jgi:uncharacterized protein (DUF1697 family)
VDRRILLLRGVNVGGRNRLPMADLRALVDALGAEDVTTYLQSGNVVCRSDTGAEELAAGLAAAIASQAGLTVPVVGRTGDEWAAVVAGNPLVDLDDDPKRLHVTFLDGPPEPGRLDEVVAAAAGFAPERMAVVGADVFLHVPHGYHEAKLSNAFLERRLGRVATTRNWRTVVALGELAGGTG